MKCLVSSLVLVNRQGFVFDKADHSDSPISVLEALEWASGRGVDYQAILYTTTCTTHLYSFDNNNYMFVMYL